MKETNSKKLRVFVKRFLQLYLVLGGAICTALGFIFFNMPLLIIGGIYFIAYMEGVYE